MPREEDIYLQGRTHKGFYVYEEDFIPWWFVGVFTALSLGSN